MDNNVYVETTNGIRISAKPEYLPRDSETDENAYAWVYHIRIENHAKESVQLISRHWKITDGYGHTQEVKGEGVVGKQPTIAPGKFFGYSSGTRLNTPSGIMCGTYQMLGKGGQKFDVVVPAFSLDSPEMLAKAN